MEVTIQSLNGKFYFKNAGAVDTRLRDSLASCEEYDPKVSAGFPDYTIETDWGPEGDLSHVNSSH